MKSAVSLQYIIIMMIILIIIFLPFKEEGFRISYNNIQRYTGYHLQWKGGLQKLKQCLEYCISLMYISSQVDVI